MANYPHISKNHSTRFRLALWDAFLLFMSLSACALWIHLASIFQWDRTTPPEQYVIAAILSGCCIVLMWNLSCALIAYTACLPLLPTSLQRIAHDFIERWGTEHSRDILRRHVQRACTTAVFITSAAPGAFAAPLLPSPDLDSGHAAATQVETIPVPALNNRNITADTPKSPSSTVSSTPEEPTSEYRYEVRTGDSLWDISANLLNTDDPAVIAEATTQLYEANSATVGQDPDMIHAGTVLTLPFDLKETP